MPSFLNSDGVWIRVRSGFQRARGGPGLLLDRDGVLIEDIGYIQDPALVRLKPGAIPVLKWARANAVPCAVVTNQSGIDRGLFGWEAFEAVQQAIEDAFSAEGVSFDAVLACPFHPNHTPYYGIFHDRWRKPGPGMLCEAVSILGIESAASWMIGDKADDVVAARAAGLAGAILIAPGSAYAGPPDFSFAVRCTTMGEALAVLRERLGGDC